VVIDVTRKDRCYQRESYCFTIPRYVIINNRSSAVADMGDPLATIDMGQKVGAAVPLSMGELGPHLTQCHLGQGLPPYQVAS